MLTEHGTRLRHLNRRFREMPSAKIVLYTVGSRVISSRRSRKIVPLRVICFFTVGSYFSSMMGVVLVVEPYRLARTEL